MPIYEFECSDCRTKFEKLCGVSATDGVTCPECDGRDVRRLISAFNSRTSGGGGSGSSCGSCAKSSCAGCHP